MIVDSNLLPSEAIRSNPAFESCPASILKRQVSMTVHYYGFDGQLHRGQIVVHEDVTTDIHDFFELAWQLQFPFAKVTPLAHPEYNWDKTKTVLEDNLTYGFNYRTIEGTNTLSQHAHGLAIDVNPMQNPYIRTQDGKRITWPDVKYVKASQGALSDDHQLVSFMMQRGWSWGGDAYTRQDGVHVVDYMHFQKHISSK